MLHANTQCFIDDWTARRGARRLPARAAIDPMAFGRLAPQLFMLGEGAASALGGSDVFRLAGGFLADLHGRDLGGASFAQLWPWSDRSAVAEAVAAARRAATPVVLSVIGEAAVGDGLAMEITLGPVTAPDGRSTRLFGLYQPTELVARLHGQVVETLSLRNVTLATDAARLTPLATPHLRLVASDGRRVA